MGNLNLTLPGWSQTTNTEAKSVTTSPAFSSPSAGLGAYAVALGLPGAWLNPTAVNTAAYVSWLRGRSMNAWSSNERTHGPRHLFHERLHADQPARHERPRVRLLRRRAATPAPRRTNPTLTAVAGFEQASLSWTSVPNASSYRIYVTKAGGAESLL